MGFTYECGICVYGICTLYIFVGLYGVYSVWGCLCGCVCWGESTEIVNQESQSPQIQQLLLCASPKPRA